MQLSIIIVNFNVKYFLEQCLFSVHKACAHITAEVFVVDNNSSDGSREYLTKKFPWVFFKWENSNVGFGKASNSVLNELTGDHVLFLNPDTLVPEDCFEKCLAFFASNKNCGGLGVRMIDGSGRFLKESKRGFPSPLTSFFKMSGLAILFSSSSLFSRYYAGHLPGDKTSEVDVLAGAFMMLSKKAIAATGGFDEDFFMYGEDVDLSYRIRQAGMFNFYFAGTCILHFKGESTQRLSSDYRKHFYGAMLLFVQKHYPTKRATLFLMTEAIAASKWLAALRKGDPTVATKKDLATAIVANQPVFTQCVQMVQHASPAVLLAGRISLQKDTESAIGTVDTIKESVRKHKIDQIIFCEGDLSFRDIILQVQQLKGKASFLFHAAGSNSIVGSNNKNARGIFITKP